MGKLAFIGENLSVESFRVDDGGTIPAHKTRSDGGLFLRPVVEEATPTYRPELSILRKNINVGRDSVLISHSVDPRTTAEQKQAVKDEAQRRIFNLYPQWKQANMTARGVELVRIGESNWSEAEQQEAALLDAAWLWINAMRQRSNEIEALSPIPSDYDADARWVI